MERSGEGQEARLVGRRVVAEASGQAHVPRAILDGAQIRPVRILGRRTEEPEQALAELVVAAQAVLGAGVREVHPDRRLGRTGDAELFQPAGRMRATPSGVHHQVRGQRGGPAGALAAHAAHAPVPMDEPPHRAAGLQADAGHGLRTLTHAVLDQPSALTVSVEAQIARLLHRARHRVRLATGQEERDLRAQPKPDGAEPVQLVREAVEERRQHLLTA